MKAHYKLINISESDYKINFDFKGIASDNVTYQIGHQFIPIYDRDQLDIIVQARFLDKASNVEIVNNTIKVSFSLIPLNDLVKPEEDKIIKTNSPQIIDTLVSVSYGTLRGVLFKNLLNTPYCNIFLPLIPSSMYSIKECSAK